jgi:hypothetical protein
MWRSFFAIKDDALKTDLLINHYYHYHQHYHYHHFTNLV